jgi:hypothetical protein
MAAPESRVSAAPRDSLAIGGVPLRIEAATAALAARVAAWAERALALTDPSPPQEPLRLHVFANGAPPQPPTGARELAAFGTCRVLRDAGRVFLLLPQARCALDLADGRARIWLAAAWWGEPLKTQQDPWLLTLVWLLRERGLYALHASCVAWGDLGLAIVGPSGSGKSSTALSLMQAGWDWVADDVVLVEPGPPARLHGLAQGFSFHPRLADRLPGLDGVSLGEKRFADARAVFSGRQLPFCRPAALLFPHVVAGETSRIDRLSPAEALMALLPAVGGILSGGPVRQSQTQLAALGALAAAVPAYRLHAARDIFGDGAALDALLAAGGVALHA